MHLHVYTKLGTTWHVTPRQHFCRRSEYSTFYNIEKATVFHGQYCSVFPTFKVMVEYVRRLVIIGKDERKCIFFHWWIELRRINGWFVSFVGTFDLIHCIPENGSSSWHMHTKLYIWPSTYGITNIINCSRLMWKMEKCGSIWLNVNGSRHM